MNVEDFEPATLALQLAQIAETDPHHEILLAVRLALEIADARRADRRALREAALDVHGAKSPAEWRQWAQTRVPFEELQRRRVQPGPLARERAA